MKTGTDCGYCTILLGTDFNVPQLQRGSDGSIGEEMSMAVHGRTRPFKTSSHRN